MLSKRVLHHLFHDQNIYIKSNADFKRQRHLSHASLNRDRADMGTTIINISAIGNFHGNIGQVPLEA